MISWLKEPKEKDRMHYPPAFQEDVRKTFPDDREIVRMLRNGDRRLGSKLYVEPVFGGIDATRILGFLDAGDIEGLRAEAGRVAQKRSLYESWRMLSEMEEKEE